MMRLYVSDTSPFGRKVRVVVRETGKEAQVEEVQAAGDPLNPGTMPVAQNPLGKIPTLERESGPALFDSRVICRFLAEGAKPALYPAAPALWEVLTLESIGDGIIDAAVTARYEMHVRPEGVRSAEWAEGQWVKVARALDFLEARWMAHLHGPLDMGQIAVGCGLGYLDLRFAEREWRKGRPSLAAWWEKLSARPSFEATRVKG